MKTQLLRCLAGTLLSSLMMFNASAELLVNTLESESWGGSTYYLLDKSTWDDAQATGVELGGNLITINNQAEQVFIDNLWGYFGSSDFAKTYLWIGLSDEADEGNFTWASGEDVTYNNFSANEPNGSTNENQVYMWYRTPSNAGTWNDFDGSRGVIYQDGVYGVIEVVNDPMGISSIGNLADVPAPYIGFLGLSSLLLLRRKRHSK